MLGVINIHTVGLRTKKDKLCLNDLKDLYGFKNAQKYLSKVKALVGKDSIEVCWVDGRKLHFVDIDLLDASIVCNKYSVKDGATVCYCNDSMRISEDVKTEVYHSNLEKFGTEYVKYNKYRKDHITGIVLKHRKGTYTTLGCSEGGKHFISCSKCEELEYLKGNVYELDVNRFKREGKLCCRCSVFSTLSKRDLERVKTFINSKKDFKVISLDSKFINVAICGKIYRKPLRNFLKCFEKYMKDRKDSIKKSINETNSFVESIYDKKHYPEGTVIQKSIKRSTDGKQTFIYTCPFCSSDSFVENGLCSGVFSINKAGLKKGSKNCRCSDKYRWTKEQAEFSIDLILRSLGGNFLKWEEEFVNSRTTFTYLCNKGHKNRDTFTNFKHKGMTCRSCSVSGFDDNKSGYFYIFRLLGHGYDFMKFGITNRTPEIRLAETSTVTELEVTLSYKKFYDDGKKLYKKESDVRSYLKEYPRCEKSILRKGFTETVKYDRQILENIKGL